MLVVNVNWYQLGLPEGTVNAHEDRFGIHAGQLETSILLALAPETVRMDRARDFVCADAALASGHPGLSFVHGAARLAWQTQDLNPAGTCGNAAAATASARRKVLDFVASRFVQVLREIDRVSPAILANRPAW